MSSNLLLLFDRPNEPIYVPKGENEVAFSVPPEYLPAEVQPYALSILNRINVPGQTTINVDPIDIPDLSIPLSLGRREGFSLFIPSHRKMAARLTEIFMNVQDEKQLVSMSVYCRDRVNSQMFNYCLSVAILHRRDTQNIQNSIPPLCQLFPDKYIDSSVFHRAKEQANVVPVGSRTAIEIPLDYTATDADPEHRVAYWREDVGINLHHWYWHLVYPFEGPEEVVKKDRRGELFYYMHHQIMSRYNIERLCNNLPRARRYQDFREPITEAYFPKLDQMVAGRSWPPRPAGFVLSDINRKADNLKFTLNDLERLRDRIVEAITTRRVRSSEGGYIELDEFNGIDILGNIMEAAPLLVPDAAYYGDLHNMGHVAISFCHDPDHRFLESFGVMGDAATAMRDPIFYRWHAFVDYILIKWKDTLPAYTAQQLVLSGVTISNVRISSENANPNTINTFWSKSDIDLSRGLDFTPRGPVMARIQHLNHDEFTYSITVNNSNNRDLTGTVRIFMAPKYDETGTHFNFNDQRLLMIEMDKFTTKLRRGQNTITRLSTESAVTIPFEATFRNIDENRPDQNSVQPLVNQNNFCGCGWPQHMLVPKGTTNGYPMDLFVMISDFEIDRINQPDANSCRTGISFCGLKDRKYPDSRSMGFPFDRVGRTGVLDTTEFITPNMKLQQITIRFTDTIKPRRTSAVAI